MAFADGALHQFEIHLVERIGRELGFSEEIVQERQRVVRERLGVEESRG